MSDFGPTHVNEPFTGSSGGLIEVVKKGVVVALRSALTGTSMSISDSPIHVELEYPAIKEKYPGVWVQFSLSELRPSGIGMVLTDPDTRDRMQQFMYQGRVTLIVVALTNLERDRLSDFLLSMLAFSRIPNPRLITENGVQETYTDLYAELDRNPHLSMTVNTDTLRPQGQTITVGVPWSPNEVVYEDSFSFDVLGEFQLITTNEGLYKLKRVDIYPEIGQHTSIKPGEWM